MRPMKKMLTIIPSRCGRGLDRMKNKK